jgi:hypothetical protein
MRSSTALTEEQRGEIAELIDSRAATPKVRREILIAIIAAVVSPVVLGMLAVFWNFITTGELVRAFGGVPMHYVKDVGWCLQFQKNMRSICIDDGHAQIYVVSPIDNPEARVQMLKW